MHHPQSIAVTGLKHVGKSTLGHALSVRLGLPFLDLDDLLVRRAQYENILPPGRTPEPPIRTVFRALGAARFGEWEAECVREIPSTVSGAAVVLATGGGVCDHPETMAVLSTNYRMLYLHNDPLVLYDRSVRGGVPAFLDPDRPREHFLEIAARRDARYREHADLVVDITGLHPDEALARIMEQVR